MYILVPTSMLLQIILGVNVQVYSRMLGVSGSPVALTSNLVLN